MFDAENHYIDPKTGFARHKDTGHLIGLEEAPVPVVKRDAEYPKWVVPHESHVVRPKRDDRPGTSVSPSNMDVDNGAVGIVPARVTTPGWKHSHVNRADGVVMVMVDDEGEEQRATSEHKEPEPAEYQTWPVTSEHKASAPAEENEEFASRMAERDEKAAAGHGDQSDSYREIGDANFRFPHSSYELPVKDDPQGWDAQRAVIMRDGAVDKAATNEERAKRGIALIK